MKPPTLFPDRPRDPRSRAVVCSWVRQGRRHLRLECGHDELRKPGLCLPKRAICASCPPAGGIGGNGFGKSREGRS
jgi:hypothetical protein